jgi:PilZ domain-containing protein
MSTQEKWLMSRRQYNRFALRGSVSFSWRELEGLRLEGYGFTRDISERGVFVVTDAHVPLHEAVRIEIVFQSPGSNSVVRMTAEGQVLRVEAGSRTETVGGFAAAIRSLALGTL